MVLCQPGTEVTAKSQDTMECTDTKIGRMMADSNRPATVWIRHCRVVPRNPMASTP